MSTLWCLTVNSKNEDFSAAKRKGLPAEDQQKVWSGATVTDVSVLPKIGNKTVKLTSILFGKITMYNIMLVKEQVDSRLRTRLFLRLFVLSSTGLPGNDPRVVFATVTEGTIFSLDLFWPLGSSICNLKLALKIGVLLRLARRHLEIGEMNLYSRAKALRKMPQFNPLLIIGKKVFKKIVLSFCHSRNRTARDVILQHHGYRKARIDDCSVSDGEVI